MPVATYQGLGAPSVPVSFISTVSTAYTLTQDDQGRLLIYNGQSSAARFNLPTPEAGMSYEIFFNSQAASSATKIIANALGTYDIVVAGLGGSTAVAVAVGTTAELGTGVKFIAINDTRWAAFQTFGTSLDSRNLESTTT